MTEHESRTIEHALDVLRAAIDDGTGRPLTPCEKLACRVLLSAVEKRALVRFCGLVESCNPLYRKSHLTLALAAIERDLGLK